MSRSVTGKIIASNASRCYAGQNYGIDGGTSPEEIDFCMNKCPHPKKSCNGECKEFREEIKKLNKAKCGGNKNAL